MIILKVNNNRDYESIKAEYSASYQAKEGEYPQTGCCDMNVGMGMGYMPHMMGRHFQE